VYSGNVNALTGSSLGAYAAAAEHRYRFTVTLPSNTDDGFQGKSAQVDFVWSAAQS
jgi:hypothetical protein